MKSTCGLPESARVSLLPADGASWAIETLRYFVDLTSYYTISLTERKKNDAEVVSYFTLVILFIGILVGKR